MNPPPLVVAFELSERRKSIVADGLAGASAIIYLAERDGAARAEALRNAGALLTHNTAKDLRSGEAALLHSARLIQFTIAGVDFIPLSELPEGVPVATNGGGYAESMAEHALAMTLAAAISRRCSSKKFAFIKLSEGRYAHQVLLRGDRAHAPTRCYLPAISPRPIERARL